MPVNPGKKAGRPKVHTEEYFDHLLSQHDAWTVGFIARHGRHPSSDVEVLTDYFREELIAKCQRCGRLQSVAIKARIKTLRNLLSQARKLIKKNGDGAISGTRNVGQ
jgi:hypothetical protein